MKRLCALILTSEIATQLLVVPKSMPIISADDAEEAVGRRGMGYTSAATRQRMYARFQSFYKITHHEAAVQRDGVKQLRQH